MNDQRDGQPTTTQSNNNNKNSNNNERTQLNTLQKNKLTADDDLSETGFYPFIHT